MKSSVHFARECLLVLMCLLSSTSPTLAERPNVLFIAIDDLRPAMGCYGDPLAVTPHIDKLAKSGTLFAAAYCQSAVCSPSRTSLLTGRRPDTTKVLDLQTHFRKHLPHVVTLPQHFKNNGYHTQGFGKIYHAIFPKAQGRELDDPPSWSEPWWGPQPHMYYSPQGMQIAERVFAGEGGKKRRRGKQAPEVSDWRDAIVRGLAWEAAPVDDAVTADGQITEQAIAALDRVKGRPFFLCVGYTSPHLPFVAPKKYFDLYPLNRIRMPDNPFPPRGVPKCALPHYSELSAYFQMPKLGEPISPLLCRDLIRAYYATASFVDAQVGRLLDELERLQLTDNTIVILWGDHGFHVGEHGFVGKGTNFELSTRSPLIVRVPGQKPGVCQALVELVDVYPSLAELCRLPTAEGLEGTSFAPLIENPTHPWKRAAFSEMLRNIEGAKRSIVGRSIRTDRYRYNEWPVGGPKGVEVELYDYKVDPQGNVNLANLPQQAAMVAAMRKQLRAGWQAALPNNP